MEGFQCYIPGEQAEYTKTFLKLDTQLPTGNNLQLMMRLF